MKPIVKWSGGKSTEIEEIMKYLPEKYSFYVEPFIGGGSLFFHLQPEKSVISDVHHELVCLYSELKLGNGVKIKEWMDLHPNDEKTYYELRDDTNPATQFEKACIFYYQRKTCFRGMMRYNKNGKFNIPFGRYKTIRYEELTDIRYKEVFKNCKIYEKDYKYIFENYDDENNFCFLDPPYDSKFTDYGYCKFGKEEQIELAKLFKKSKMKCLMIIGKTDFIMELYSGYICAEYPKKYRFKIHSGRVGDEINTIHLVIKNY